MSRIKFALLAFVIILILKPSDATIQSETIYYEELITKRVGDTLTCEGNTSKNFQNYLTKSRKTLHKSDLQWMLPMYDAWGKFQSGMLIGNFISYGQFDECVNIGTDHNPNNAGVIGKYCGFAVTTIFSGLPYSWAICIPDKCTLGHNSFNISNNITVVVTDVLCQTLYTYSELEWDDWVTIGFLLLTLVIILTSTAYDCYLHHTTRHARRPLLIAFSLLTNAKKLFSVSSSADQVQCLHGLRTISLMWIIAGHRFVGMASLPVVNGSEALKFRNNIKSSYIVGGRAAVDTFFLFSAFLVSYIYFKRVRVAIVNAKESGQVRNPLTWNKLPMYYIHRLLRITPALAAVFFVQITVFRRMGAGPLWPIIEYMSVNACTKWWWSFFLYVQNYVNYKEIVTNSTRHPIMIQLVIWLFQCIVPTWYLSADMQLYILSPFLIIPLGDLLIRGKQKLVYIIMCLLILISIFVPMTIEFFRNFDKENIYETHHRISVYTIGILLGMITIDCSGKKINIPPFVNLFLWGLASGVMLTIIITMHDIEMNPSLEKNNVFFSLTRPLWSAAICWIIFACHFGYGGPANWLLSKSIFQVMTKLSFSMYLLHNLVNTLAIGTIKVSPHFSEFETMYGWCGDYIFTIFVATLWVLAFESPIVSIEKIIFGTGTDRVKSITAAPQIGRDKIEQQLA